ncbi:hypothetical protein UPYG_G00228070 [Umbra pygmaea]|uniref:C2H2-type domain-containing protein n=1 Tax=Umbra pygmaea TaxID=75934 RepID=A0ABD0WEI9_UMBPY
MIPSNANKQSFKAGNGLISISPSSMARQRKCILCQIVYNSKQEMDEHMRSMLHHRELENLKGRDCGHECKVCRVTMVSLTDYANHISSQVHKQLVDRVEKEGASNDQEEEYFDKELVKLIETRQEQIRKDEVAAAQRASEEEERRMKEEEYMKQQKQIQNWNSARQYFFQRGASLDWRNPPNPPSSPASLMQRGWDGGNSPGCPSSWQTQDSRSNWHNGKQGRSATWHAQEPPNYSKWPYGERGSLQSRDGWANHGNKKWEGSYFPGQQRGGKGPWQQNNRGGGSTGSLNNKGGNGIPGMLSHSVLSSTESLLQMDVTRGQMSPASSFAQLPQGALVKPQGALVKPQGALVKPQGALVKPQGALVKPQGALVKPQGALVKPKVLRLNPKVLRLNPKVLRLNPKVLRLNPKVLRFKPQGAPVKPQGAPVKPQGAPVKPQGAPVKPQGAPIKAQVDGRKGAHQNVELRTPGGGAAELETDNSLGTKALGSNPKLDKVHRWSPYPLLPHPHPSPSERLPSGPPRTLPTKNHTGQDCDVELGLRCDIVQKQTQTRWDQRGAPQNRTGQQMRPSDHSVEGMDLGEQQETISRNGSSSDLSSSKGPTVRRDSQTSNLSSGSNNSHQKAAKPQEYPEKSVSKHHTTKKKKKCVQ